MSTFCEVSDAVLIELIRKAKKRVVLVTPGVYLRVAQTLAERFKELGRLHITIVLDPDEEVCRIGYGDAAALKLLNEEAQKNNFALMSQPGLRVGVLLADDTTLVWSPTPRAIEAPPGNTTSGLDLFSPSTSLAPNGLMLGTDPGEQLAKAVSAAGTDTLPDEAEIGKSPVKPSQVINTLNELEKNPPIPVDLARITRVFSTKLQFVEFTVKRALLSRMQLTLSKKLLNADIKGELQGLIESKLRAFGEFRDDEIEVNAYINGEPTFDSSRLPLKIRVSEASLERQRTDIERRYLYNIPGFGRLIAKDDKQEFEKLIKAYETQLKDHSKGIRAKLKQQADKIIKEAVEVIVERARRGGSTLDKDQLSKELTDNLIRAKEEEPGVLLVFKDVTYEQTKSLEFREKVEKALPKNKRQQLGQWTKDFDAAEAAVAQQNK